MRSKPSPICGTHGTPKNWIKDKHNKAGGRWRCTKCSSSYLKKYRSLNKTTLAEKDSIRMASRRADPNINKTIKENRRKSMSKSRKLMKLISKIDPNYLSEEGLLLKERADIEKTRIRKAAALRKARITESLCFYCHGNKYEAHSSGTCWICHNNPATQTDHVLPLSKGGLHCNTNFRGACSGCNWAKGSRTWPGQPDWDLFVSERKAITQPSSHTLRSPLTGST